MIAIDLFERGRCDQCVGAPDAPRRAARRRRVALADRDDGEGVQNAVPLAAGIAIVDCGVRHQSSRQTLDDPHSALPEAAALVIAGK